jgi:hypothetical protein
MERLGTHANGHKMEDLVWIFSPQDLLCATPCS